MPVTFYEEQDMKTLGQAGLSLGKLVEKYGLDKYTRPDLDVGATLSKVDQHGRSEILCKYNIIRGVFEKYPWILESSLDLNMSFRSLVEIVGAINESKPNAAG